MNTLHIIGNLTGNPESRAVQGANGMNTVCNFTVAVNRYVRGQKTTDYFRITLWNKQADNAMKYLAKGRQVGITGPVTARAYMGKTDNQPHCSMEIQDVKEIEYLGGRPEGSATADDAPAPGGYQDDSYTPVDDPELPLG